MKNKRQKEGDEDGNYKKINDSRKIVKRLDIMTTSREEKKSKLFFVLLQRITNRILGATHQRTISIGSLIIQTQLFSSPRSSTLRYAAAHGDLGLGCPGGKAERCDYHHVRPQIFKYLNS